MHWLHWLINCRLYQYMPAGFFSGATMRTWTLSKQNGRTVFWLLLLSLALHRSSLLGFQISCALLPAGWKVWWWSNSSCWWLGVGDNRWLHRCGWYVQSWWHCCHWLDVGPAAGVETMAAQLCLTVPLCVLMMQQQPCLIISGPWSRLDYLAGAEGALLQCANGWSWDPVFLCWLPWLAVAGFRDLGKNGNLGFELPSHEKLLGKRPFWSVVALYIRRAR